MSQILAITRWQIWSSAITLVFVLDRKGNIRHDGGVVTEAPGVYLLGLTFLRRRKSSLIDGVGDDARDLSAHLARYLGAA